MARGRGGPRRPGKTIDNLRWSGGQAIAVNTLTAGSQAVNALAAGVPRETIMRTRGEVLVYIDSAQAPSGLALISMGLVLVPEGQSSTVIWDPFNDSEAPWFWFQEVFVGYEEMVIDVIDVPGITAHRIIVDSKAMRRANVDEEVQFVVTNTTVNGARKPCICQPPPVLIIQEFVITCM